MPSKPQAKAKTATKAKTQKSRSTVDCPLVADPRVRQAADAGTAKIKGQFPPGISQPALRALVSARLTKLSQLTRVTEEQLSRLHGMGPKAIGIFRDALRAQGKSFKDKSFNR